jgi:hypothetical protein
MLQNMGNTGGIFGYGSQGNQKHIFRVICRYMDMLCPGVAVTIFSYLNIQGFNALTAQKLKGRVCLWVHSIHIRPQSSGGEFGKGGILPA